MVRPDLESRRVSSLERGKGKEFGWRTGERGRAGRGKKAENREARADNFSVH